MLGDQVQELVSDSHHGHQKDKPPTPKNNNKTATPHNTRQPPTTTPPSIAKKQREGAIRESARVSGNGTCSRGRETGYGRGLKNQLQSQDDQVPF